MAKCNTDCFFKLTEALQNIKIINKYILCENKIMKIKIIYKSYKVYTKLKIKKYKRIKYRNQKSKCRKTKNSLNRISFKS